MVRVIEVKELVPDTGIFILPDGRMVTIDEFPTDHSEVIMALAKGDREIERCLRAQWSTTPYMLMLAGMYCGRLVRVRLFTGRNFYRFIVHANRALTTPQLLRLRGIYSRLYRELDMPIVVELEKDYVLSWSGDVPVDWDTFAEGKFLTLRSPSPKEFEAALSFFSDLP